MKQKKHVIQPEIKVTQEWVDEIIEKYKKQPKTMKLAFGDFCGNADDMIREIKEMSDVGKQILMMEHRFQTEFPKFMEKFEKTPFGKAGKELKELLEKGIKDENKRTNKQNL